MIAIVGAMQEEVALLHGDLEQLQAEERGMRTYTRGRLYGQDVVLVFSRWGKTSAASTVTSLVERYGVEALIFTGAAGGLAAELHIGDLVIGESFVHHDVDASPIPIYKKYEVPLLGMIRFPADPVLAARAMAAAERFIREDLVRDLAAADRAEFGIVAPKVRRGLIASGDQFIAGAARRDALLADFPDLLCVEMEGAPVAQVCFEHRVPMVAIRAISDQADHRAHIDFPRFLERVASHFTRGVVRQMLRAWPVQAG